MIKVTMKIDDTGWDEDPTDLDELHSNILFSVTHYGGIPSSDIDIEISND